MKAFLKDNWFEIMLFATLLSLAFLETYCKGTNNNSKPQDLNTDWVWFL